jgi:hypothetical protein
VEKTPVHGNFTMDGNDNKGPFRHSWWRILLIVFAVVAFIITCTFNGLAGAGPNGRNHFDRFQILEISIVLYKNYSSRHIYSKHRKCE